jgi:hypothetical protein
MLNQFCENSEQPSPGMYHFTFYSGTIMAQYSSNTNDISFVNRSSENRPTLSYSIHTQYSVNGSGEIGVSVGL